MSALTDGFIRNAPAWIVAALIILAGVHFKTQETDRRLERIELKLEALDRIPALSESVNGLRRDVDRHERQLIQ